MATIFNKRLFGTDLDPAIKDKLRARQILAKHSVLPNDSSEFVTINGQQFSVKDLIGESNFNTIGKGVNNPKLSLGDLSSRTPFARMWTAVELYWSQPDIFGDDYGMVSFEIDTSGGYSLYDTKWKKRINKTMIQEAATRSYQKRVYTVNNHLLNQL